MVVLFTGQEVERISIKLSESLNYKITSRPLLTKKKGKCIFITPIKICHTLIRPIQTNETIFSVDSLKFVVKELSVGWWQLLDREGLGQFSLV